MNIKCGTVHNLEVPDFLRDYLVEIGGSNIYGDPNYRIVWSNNATRPTRMPWPVIPGVDIIERPHRLRYGKAMVRDRFILEKWHPASHYGDPEDWEETGWKPEFGRVDYGPYPSRGRYEQVDTIEGIDVDGNPCFAWPTRQYLWTALKTVEYVKGMTLQEQQYATEAREEAEERARFNRRLDMIKDANRPFVYSDAWVSMTPGKAR